MKLVANGEQSFQFMICGVVNETVIVTDGDNVMVYTVIVDFASSFTANFTTANMLV